MPTHKSAGNVKVLHPRRRKETHGELCPALLASVTAVVWSVVLLVRGLLELILSHKHHVVLLPAAINSITHQHRNYQMIPCPVSVTHTFLYTAVEIN